MAPATSRGPESDVRRANRLFYDALWSGARLIDPERFNTWPLVRSLISSGGRRLEVAPGLRPRLPIQGTQFADISSPALQQLSARGALVVQSAISALPFATGAFELVVALDVIEHVEDDEAALAELSRVTCCGGTVLLSAPLHPDRWSAFDDLVGHQRRYEPQHLVELLAQHHLAIEHSTGFGMQPHSSLISDLGAWWLTHHRAWALWWYNRLLMPLALRRQAELSLTPGLIATEAIDEVLLVCRRERSPRLAPAIL